MPRSSPPAPILIDLQAIVRIRCRHLLDQDDRWVGLDGVEYLRAALAAAVHVPKSKRREILVTAQEFLAPFACGGRRPWTDVDYCPPTPYGQYHWTFTCLMVQELIWLHPAFVEGYAYGLRDASASSRNKNPYPDTSRRRAWDLGYVLSLAELKALRDWVEVHHAAA